MQLETLKRPNDFVLKVATVNGTGSASANGLISKAIFRMGVPISTKNLFPSNIQGLPTWFEIRANAAGHTGRRGKVDIMVAMNPQTYGKDVKEVAPGGYFIYDDTWPVHKEFTRTDIHFIGVPLARLCTDAFADVRQRILMKNITYVGILAALLDIDPEITEKLLGDSYGSKPKLLDSNRLAVKLGYDYAKKNLTCPLPMHVEKINKTAGHIIIDGNNAAALGCLYAGATVAAWYPITPSTSLMDAFASYANRYRTDKESGKKRVAIIQAEDELAAIGMVLGANFAGARAFTATSGPGISLMNEFLGCAYYTEVPVVLFNVQRTGPSTGMPTRTQQSDLLLCAYASHGDTKHILIFPADPEECFYMATQAFDIAERVQTPVIVMLDLDIGMNEWMSPTFKWDDQYKADRGKVFNAEQLEKMPAFYRYLDVDGDGICARTYPGTHPKGAFFNRGSGHNKHGGYTEDPDEYCDVMERLKVKLTNSVHWLPKPVLLKSKSKSPVGIISLGSCDCAVREALEELQKSGDGYDYLRVRSFPFHNEVRDFINQHEKTFVVEQNRDAQLRSLLINELNCTPTKLVPINYYGGLPISSDFIVAAISKGGNA